MLHAICLTLAVWFLVMGAVNAMQSRRYLALWCMIVFMVTSIIALNT